jgi:hypothetical protein
MRCDSCEFEWGSVPRDEVAARLGAATAGLAERLTATAPDDLRRRPDPEVWSAIEYACHVRDVLLVMRERVLLILRSSSPPAIAPMGRDERVVHDRYREQAPADVSRQLLDAAAMLVFLFDGIDDELWGLTCIYGYPEPAERTLAWVAQHVVHEAEHHLADLVESLPKLQTAGIRTVATDSLPRPLTETS